MGRRNNLNVRHVLYEYICTRCLCMCSQLHLLLGHLLRRALLAVVGVIPRRGAEQRAPVDAHVHRRHAGRARARTASLAARLLNTGHTAHHQCSPPPLPSLSLFSVPLHLHSSSSPLLYSPHILVHLFESNTHTRTRTSLLLLSSLYSISHFIVIFSPL